MRGRALLIGLATAAFAAGCGDSSSDGGSSSAPGSAPAQTTVQLTGTKEHLLGQTTALVGFTEEFKAQAHRYDDLAASTDYDYQQLLAEHPDEVRTMLEGAKQLWVEGNPLYERMEGIVAGVPELSTYDVILDAGTSAQEDPAGAVPFDLETADGRTLKQPGNLYNLTEEALWGTGEQFQAEGVTPDLDGNGTVEFGEAVPDAQILASAADAFDTYARKLATDAEAWQPGEDDAFTALVVMVPTMSEYFGQWKESRFVSGAGADSSTFNVVSRLSDINDILAGLEVVYGDLQPVIATSNPAAADQTGEELAALSAFIEDLAAREASGKRFTREQAEVLGVEAQDRGTAIAGQIAQSAAALGIQIEQ